jgi:predicted anti-sigma-YlaC factor YlaD
MKHYTEDILIDYIHGELPGGEDVLVHAHLAACDDCRALHDAEAAFGDMLRASASSQELEFPSIIKARVWAAIRDAEPTFADRLRSFLRPAIAAPVVAALAIAVYLGAPILHSGIGAPSVGVAYYLEEHAAEAQENPLADHTNVNASIALDRANAPATAPLIDAADAATLDDDASPAI